MSAPLPAYTVWQPWASLIVLGAKPYEFRKHRHTGGNIGRRIAIHAGSRKPPKTEIRDLLARLNTPAAAETGLRRELAIPLLERLLQDPDSLPRGAIVGTALLGQPTQNPIVDGVRLNDSDRNEHCNWAWPLTEIVAVTPPVPASGMQGWWTWRREGAA